MLQMQRPVQVWSREAVAAAGPVANPRQAFSQSGLSEHAGLHKGLLGAHGKDESKQGSKERQVDSYQGEVRPWVCHSYSNTIGVPNCSSWPVTRVSIP